MSIEIAVDVGGTFTDFVVRAGGIAAYKSSTTPLDIADGIFNGLALIARRRGTTTAELLAATSSFACGTTVATNAILEHKAARTGLLITEGFRDTLLIREGGKADTYNIYMDYPEPYIPRSLTIGVRERINAEGGIETPLDEAGARRAIAELKSLGVEAVAVSLLWSIANPAHELRLAELLTEEWPEIPFSLGHQVNPALREYRRTSAVAIDASLKPVVQRRLAEIETRLRANGFQGVLTFVTSNGGRTSAEEVLAKPVYLCLSGPSAAPHAGSVIARTEGIAHGNVITIDMGGTSFDVSITTGWDTPTHREGVIGGHMFGVPAVDVRTIGAGGGSIARVDAGGFAHVGPASAGAYPGPACYGRGGTLPTVTDANLALGLIEPAGFADGQITLSRAAAETAITTHVATPLGIALSEAASLMTLSVEQNMVAAIEDITIRRGVDPREYVLVSGGSAAGLHAAGIARELGIGQVIVSPLAGVLSAYGIATGDIRFNFARSLFTSSVAFDFARVTAVLAELAAEGSAYLDRMRIPAERRLLAFSVEARYAGQVWQLSLPLPRPSVANAEDLAGVVAAFHALHERVHAIRADDPVEFIEWDLIATGKLPINDAAADTQAGPDASAALIGQRRVYLKQAGGAVDIPVYDGEALRAGNVVAGPALVQERLTVTLVPPDATAQRSVNGGLIVTLERDAF